MKSYYKEINDQTVFFEEPLIHDGMQTFNPSEEMILAAGWQEWQEPEPSEAELLQQAIENKLAEIDNYDKSAIVNSFKIGNKDLWLDAALRQQLRTSIEAYKAMGRESASKWFDGVEYTFPVDTWLQMLNALEVYAAEALNATESHKVAVKELTTIQEVEEYDITADYPEKLVFGA
jgi:hypothetical protein